MVFESPGSFSGRQIPKTQGFIPGTRKSVISIAGKYYVRDEVRVAMKTFLRYTVLRFFTGQFPYDQSFVWKVNMKYKGHNTWKMVDHFLHLREMFNGNDAFRLIASSTFQFGMSNLSASFQKFIGDNFFILKYLCVTLNRSREA